MLHSGIHRVSQVLLRFSTYLPRPLTPTDPPESHLYQSLRVGFRHVKNVAICFLPLLTGLYLLQGSAAFSYGLYISLCTLHLPCSIFSISAADAALGMGSWLDLTQLGFSPSQKRKAYLGALTNEGFTKLRVAAIVAFQLKYSNLP